MKRTKALRLVIYLFAFAMVAIVSEGCNASKKCGCGTDLNSVFKPSKKYR